MATSTQAPPATRRPRVLLVVTSAVPANPAGLRRELGDDADLRVVAPVLQSPLNHAMNDRRAHERAAERLETWLKVLGDAGIDATGEVGDDDPVLALEDGVATFRPDRIVIATAPLAGQAWLERGSARAARQRVATPIRQLVVEPDGALRAPARGLTGTDDAGDRRARLVLWATGALAAFSTFLWFAVGWLGLPSWQQVALGAVFDVGPKVLFLSLLWRYRTHRRNERGRGAW